MACQNGTTSPEACSGDKCDLWGPDDRLESFEVGPEFFDSYVRSTGALVLTENLDFADGGGASMDESVPSFGDAANLCEDVRFREQPQLAFCSGFFVGENLFATAAHCLSGYGLLDQADETCSETSIVFDYGYDQDPKDDTNAPFASLEADNLYHCTDILIFDYPLAWDDPWRTQSGYSNDFALIALDRKVEGRTPFRLRQEGEIAAGEEVLVVGYPSGLPAKVGVGGVVQESYKTGQGDRRDFDIFKGFSFDLDLFGGNSGGPVFNAKTGVVEGVVHAYSAKNFAPRENSSECRSYGECGVNVDCHAYPSAYPVTEYAAEIAQYLESY